MSESDIDELTNTFENLNINHSLIRAYVVYNSMHHNNYYFFDYISNNYEHNHEILLEINNLYRLYSTEVKNDLLKYNIYNINEKSAEFLTCILAYIDNFFDHEYYHEIYMQAIYNLQLVNLIN